MYADNISLIFLPNADVLKVLKEKAARRRDEVFCAVAGRAFGRVCNQLGVRRINRSSEGLRRWRRRDVLCPAELASHLSESAAQTTRRKYQFINVCRRRRCVLLLLPMRVSHGAREVLIAIN